jgi:diguanylate cyclase (GGDEF)-like protein
MSSDTRDELDLTTGPAARQGGLTAYDLMAGLYHRDAFILHFGQALRRQWRTPTALAIVLVRLEHVAVVAGCHGRGVADELIGSAATRVRSCVREIDAMCRLDDSSLAVLVEGQPSLAPAHVMASEVAQRLVSSLSEPLSTTAGDLTVPARIGIAIADPSCLDPDELLGRAAVAADQATGDTGTALRFFDIEAQDAAVRRLEMKAALSRSLEVGGLSLRYQPLVSLESRATVGMEALLRWQDPRLGSVPPSDFIPLAEETGLIVSIGSWVLETATKALAEWTRTVPGLPALGLSVNVSGRQLTRPGLVATTARCLEEAGLAPELLLLELTESAFVADDDVARAQLHGLREMGVRIALDDFGTGWASLEYVNRMPVDVLKIAQVFVDQMVSSARGAALVRAIIDLAHALGLITVAEGVEHEEQADRLRQMGCYLGQGWYFARELAHDDATVAMHEVAAGAYRS